MDWLSRGVEVLIEEVDAGKDDYDVIIVGSGYGGAVAASRLARSGRSVCVLERGREYLPGEFPNDVAHLPKHVRVSRSDKSEVIGEADALIDIRIGKDVSAMVGSALGGTSQLNAAVAEEARPEVFASPPWPSFIRHRPHFLKDDYQLAREMLGVSAYERTPAPQKLTALRKLNREIAVDGTDDRTRCRPLGVAIRQPGITPVTAALAPQQPCRQCGDCCSGCNFWAKNTLTMNYLPDARAHGASLYTGVSVLTVARNRRWLVNFRPTARQNDSSYRKVRTLRADTVILAAGSFGSTEILLRSKRKGLIKASDQLGAGFSCNGDTLAFGYDQDAPVNAIGWGSAGPDRRPDPVVGPMAAGIIDLRDATCPDQRVVIEDGAIPGPLAHLAGELLTTSGMLAQLSSFRLKGDRIGRSTDPLAISRQAMERTQVFLIMGHDDAAGRLEFGKQGDDVEGTMQVKWEGVGDQAVYQAVENILDAARNLGGIPIPNPIWKPLPDSMSSVLSGPSPRGSLVTVHPLGGCRMADECTTGVVNHWGQVFDTRTSTSVHEGLYVMDGAIVPSALAINPLLTITALAERNVRALATARGWVIDYGKAGDPLPPVPDVGPPYRAREDESVDVRLREKLVGSVRGDDRPFRTEPRCRSEPARGWETRLGRWLGDPAKYEGGCNPEQIHLELELEFPVRDVIASLQEENRRFPVTGDMFVVEVTPSNPGDEVHWHNDPGGGADSRLLEGPSPPSTVRSDGKIEVEGSIAMLHRDHDPILCRIVRAIRYWWKLRGEEEACREINCSESKDKPAGERIVEIARRSWSLVKLAAHAGERRYMTYELAFRGRDNVEYVLLGRKTIAFAEGINVWRSLVDLDVVVKHRSGTRCPASGRVTMNFLDAVRNRPPQIEKQPHAMAGWTALAALALFVARLVIKTYLWHFRAPDYPPEPVEKLQRPGPVAGVVGPEQHWITTADDVRLLMSHYWDPAHRDSKLVPLVVTHGFAHSCAIFTSPTLERCLVKHLCECGFDVWLVELRTSTALDSCRRQWSFDEVAIYDLPRAVKRILELTGSEQVDVLAHCMGAAVFSMGVLLGEFDSGRWIRAAVMSQIGPFIVGSPSNQLRTELAAFLEDVVGLDHIDVSAHQTKDWLPILADRIAATYPVELSEGRAHDAVLPCPPRTDLASCHRITAVYGQNWPHGNIDRRTHEAMGGLLGAANMKTFRQITDFVQRGRVVFEGGINEYFLDHSIEKYMTFPIAFLHGKRSDVFDPETSRRNFARISQVQGGRTHLCVVKQDFGHLDLWLGCDAHREVYPWVDRFLTSNLVSQDPGPGEVPTLKPAVRGPVLGWTRPVFTAGVVPGVYVRVWWEIDTTETDPPKYGVVFAVDEGAPDSKPSGDLIGVWTSWEVRTDRGERKEISLTTYAIADVPVDRLIGKSLWVGSLHLPVFAIGVADGGADEREYVDPLKETALGTFRPGGHKPEQPLSFALIKDAFSALEAHRIVDNLTTPNPDHLNALGSNSDRLAFLIGSCRYPGTMFENERADRPFLRMHERIAAGDPVGMVLMVGDQIYADATAGVLDTESARSRVVSRYQKAWSSQAFATLTGNLPVYFAIDDHELWDNFEPTHDGVTDPLNIVEVSREAWARLAYSVYQASVGRLGPVKPRVPPADFSYEFAAGGFRFFCLDSRTSRESRNIDTGTRNYRIAAKGHEALIAWLKSQRNDDRPKFVVSGSVLAPLTRDGADRQKAYRRREDGWGGYFGSLNEVIDVIATDEIRNVVFLSGDSHCSMTVGLEFRSADNPQTSVRAIGISASPFYAPIPFANGRRADYAERTAVVTPNGNRLTYQALDFVEVDGEQGFHDGGYSRISVHRRTQGWRIVVRTFDAGNRAKPLSRRTFLLP